MTKYFKLINNVLGWIMGIFAPLVYILTTEATASWWDCGEYIATAYKLLVGHPPGAPTFQLIGRFFSMFAGGDVTKVAHCINCMSAICSGLTIMFLFWTITRLGKKMVDKMGEMTTGRVIAIFGSALVGALTYTFTDTFWFSAVEGEVYAMSSFFTALVFWCILKWDEEYDNPKSNVNPNRWIVLIAYLIGLSIGVHLLNLLTLPAIVLIIFFKLSKKASIMGVVQAIAFISFFVAFMCPTAYMLLIWIFITVPLFVLCAKKGSLKSKAEWGVLLSLGGSFVLLGLILYGIIPQVVNLAGKFEIFFVNSIGLPFNSGTIIFFFLLFGLIAYILYYAYKKKKSVLLAGMFSFIFLLIGYSTFFTLVIRSNADPTIDENNPEDAVALLSYLNREQYGSNPLFYGESYNSRVINSKDGNPFYVKDKKSKRYVISNYRKNEKSVYAPADCMLFPRMWSREKQGEYINWLTNEYNSNSSSDKENRRSLEKGKLPTFQQNLKFMHTYQFNYMYFRYFMWNFSGRQNDIQGRGDIENGNFVTGIPPIDKALIGTSGDLPITRERPGHNRYYMLPLLLGLIGLVFYSVKDGKNSFVVLWLFLMTGMAIAFYLNMYAFQPRERDYAFAASFYAFSIWIGFGVFGIYSLFEKIKNNRVQVAASLLVTLVCIGLVPGIMAAENWDDHDRSNRYTALAIAKNYLDSCAPNAILFTLGDNDTFPLWYAQEVEGYRTDVRVCNLSLLSTSWYVDQMKRKAYNSDPLPISMNWDQYKDGTRDVMVLQPAGSQFVDLKEIVDYFKLPDFDNQRNLLFLDSQSGYRTNGRPIPASFSLSVDKNKVLANGTVRPQDSALVVDKLRWNMNTNSVNTLAKAYIIMMDILVNNNWERPVYYASTTGSEAYLGLEPYFQLEGFAYRLVPIQSPKRGGYELGRVNSDILYDNLMNVFNDHSRTDRVNHPDATLKEPYPYLWGGFNDPRVYHNEDNVRLLYIVRKMYDRLADQLISENKLDSAELVLDHGNKLLDYNMFPYLMTCQPGYSQCNLFYFQKYFKLGTPSGIKKGYDMANKFFDCMVAEFNWLDKCDARTIELYHQSISNDMLFLGQFRSAAGEYFGQIQPRYKELNISHFAPKYLDVIEKSLVSRSKSLNNSQGDMGYDFQELKQILAVAQYSGNEEIAKRALQIAENTLTVLDNVDRGLGQSYRDFFYDR